MLQNASGIKTFYDKVTGKYSEAIAEIFGFELLLPNRDSGKLEAPPPAYYFLPYYIDQKRSWSKALDNFGNLGQYSSWQSNTLKYHVGLINDKFFEIERQIVGKKEKRHEHEVRIEKFEAAISVVESIIPKNELIVSADEFANTTRELESLVSNLAKEQEDCLTSTSDINDEITFLENQRCMLSAMVTELLDDYRFTVENIPSDIIECPLCGVLHDNSISSRASILADSDKAQQELLSISSKISRLQGKKNLLSTEINRIIGEMSQLDEKIRSTTKATSFEGFIHGVASNAVQNKVKTKISDESSAVHTIASQIKVKQKEQRELIPKEEKDSIYANFLKYLTRYLAKLDATNINLSEVEGPMDYNAIQREGGAAEGSRAMLAYYLAIYSSIKQKPNTSIAPITIDTPNQHEQSHINYSKIVTLIKENIIVPESQVFLCAMKNADLDVLTKHAKIFHLDAKKILYSERYKIVSDEFTELGIKSMLAQDDSKSPPIINIEEPDLEN